jgi:CRISPR-associated protein Cmr4
MNAIVYKITCLTNLHVGSGEANFDIIDNTVEKDPVTGLPTINSSGVKGALLQHLSQNECDAGVVTSIFGTSKQESVETESENAATKQTEKVSRTAPGQVKFYQADLLARPARASKGEKAYYLVTSDMAIEQYKKKMEIFACPDGAEKTLGDEGNEVEVEGITSKNRINLCNNDFVILSDAQLKNLSLPVLVRNQVEDGISHNLWYEEVVPHKSIFTFAVSSENTELLSAFTNVISKNPYVQFGGNASIGYGLCKVEEIGRKGV